MLGNFLAFLGPILEGKRTSRISPINQVLQVVGTFLNQPQPEGGRILRLQYLSSDLVDDDPKRPRSMYKWPADVITVVVNPAYRPDAPRMPPKAAVFTTHAAALRFV